MMIAAYIALGIVIGICGGAVILVGWAISQADEPYWDGPVDAGKPEANDER